MRSFLIKLAAGMMFLASPALAEVELNFYLGTQASPHSRVTGTRADTSSFSNLIGWEGRSTSPPPYYGLRATYWRPNDWGFGVELTHTKAYAPTADMPTGFTRLEFTDGHNILTLNLSKRWKGVWLDGRLTPYVSAGVGVAIPHVDVTENGNVTYGYQLTGPAARVGAGVSYQINDRWSVFGEYQFTWSDNEADLTGGGSLETTLITNAVNVGVGLHF